MNEIKRHVSTALAFAIGQTLVCLMLMTALVCKLTEWIGKAEKPR